jgi:chaperonin GroES
MKFRPLGDRVVVRRVKGRSEDRRRHHHPRHRRRRSPRKAKSSPSAPALSTITASASPEVKAGDFVLFGKWSGTEVKVDGEELLIMKESDIMGILSKAATPPANSEVANKPPHSARP